MNWPKTLVMLCACLLMVLLHIACAQYMPHRMPNSRLYLNTASQNTNPFARAYEDQGYLQKFNDYGRQTYQPVQQTPKKVNKVKKEKEEKIEFDYFEGSDDEDEFKSPALDYNDAIGFKDFDPFKFVSQGVAGIGKFTDLGGIGDLGSFGNDDGMDYGNDYRKK